MQLQWKIGIIGQPYLEDLMKGNWSKTKYVLF